MPPDGRPVYRLDIQDDNRGASSPEINRLRSLLKRLPRSFWFKCLRIEELHQVELGGDVTAELGTPTHEKGPAKLPSHKCANRKARGNAK
jgi:hypothetical protein